MPSYPARQVSYTLTSGSISDVKQDMTVNFYSSGGTRKATLRVASGQSITSTVLPVAEFASGVYNVAIGDTFKVIQTWSIFDRLIGATATLPKDSRIAVGTNTSAPPAVCNSGGLYAGFDTTVSFNGSTSFRVNPSAGSLTHSWDSIDGSPSTSSSANPTFVFPVGERWISHTITDSASGKTTTQFIWVRVHDRDTDPPMRVQMDSLSGNVNEGWRATFKLPYGSEGNITNLPDGALVVYHEIEHRNGSTGSYGSKVSGRSHIKGVFYLVSDSIHIDPENSEITFEAVSPLAILDQTPALPQLMINKASPISWQELKSLSTQKMFVYLSYWHSTLQDTFDFVWNDGLDLSYTRIAVEGMSIGEQLRDIANSLNLQVTCDRLGRILFTRDPNFLSLTDRATRTITYDLTTADIMNIELTRQHRGAVKQIRGEGITSSNAPVFTNSPGNAPAPFGTASDTLSKQIVTNQADLNRRTGLAFARANALYNGLFVPKGVRLQLTDSFDIFEPGYREFITLTLAANSNTRGVGFDDTERWTVEQVEITFDPVRGTKDYYLVIDHETYGVDGITYIPPQQTDNGIITAPPPMDIQWPNIAFDPTTDSSDNPIVSAPAQDGNTVLTWASDLSWYVTHVFLMSLPPFNDDTPSLGGFSITDVQPVGLGSKGVYLIANDGTDSKLFYATDYTDPSTWTVTSISGVYTAIRPTSTQGGVYILTLGGASSCVDFLSGDGPGDWVEVAFNGGGGGCIDTTVGNYNAGADRFEAVYCSLADGKLQRIQWDLPSASTIVSVEVTVDWDATLITGSSFFAVGITYDGVNVASSAQGSPSSDSNFVLTYNTLTNGVSQIQITSTSFTNPSDGHSYIKKIRVCYVVGGTVKTRYSSDYGASFASAVSVGDAPGAYAGFDTQKIGAVVLVGTNGQVKKATSAGGAYSSYGSAMPAGAQPNCIWIPRYKSDGSANSGSNPDYYVVSNTLTAGNAAVWYVSSSGTVFTDRTPVVSGDYGKAVSYNCLANAFKSGGRVAAVLDFDGTTRLQVSTNAGAAWTNRDTVLDAIYVRYQRGDATLQKLYMASSGGALIVSLNHGADLVTITSPDMDSLIGAEPLG